jgi:hypothetical protein
VWPLGAVDGVFPGKRAAGAHLLDGEQVKSVKSVKSGSDSN